MDISTTIADMKKDPHFAKNVGMILVHNGIVRGWSRGDRTAVCKMKVTSDLAKIEQIRQDIESMDGIYKVAFEARSGVMVPGDDVLFLVVAGDIRENVKPALALMLDRVKAEAVTKEEYFEEGSA
ncbi:molybdenum cofactor biosynthesis protein MoaE [uncultured Desulfuromonas sp.]|uniref:molybdenum cofactor biosynthesis protein MoaE n=1 Tax=uncultured Desulfuromonas sp. TaxID=181013 RepID=UPI002AAAA748|nr:molybdenum cofactor biosynthesis protein MoaE [uncultured Desulfuromonas sp.]